MPDEVPGLPPINSNSPLPLPELSGERRKEQDRRASERQGKYDRRRNRCANCLHYKPSAKTDQGFCQFHKTAILAYAFACPNFEAIRPEPRQ